jgi:hypothetical protein
MCPHCFLYLPKKDSTEGKWRLVPKSKLYSDIDLVVDDT